MKVLCLPPAKDGCAFYRLREPARVLTEAGHDVTVSDDFTFSAGYDQHGKVVAVVPPDCDVVVLQRPTVRALAEAIPCLQRRGVAVVVEVDDDFASIPPSNGAFHVYHPRNGEHSWRWLMQACRDADLVTVTTPALASVYGPGHAAVLPNCVPAWYGTVRKPRNPAPVVGWTGTPTTHGGDLQVTSGAVGRALRATGAAFRAIGSAQTLTVLDVSGTVVPWQPLGRLYAEAVATLDVGLVPLADTRFNRGKSAIKMTEYAALGVVPVVSPTPDNLRVAGLGVGCVVRRPREWEGALRRVLSDPRYRADLAAAGKAAVLEHLTYEDNAWRWWEAWAEALGRRRGRSAA